MTLKNIVELFNTKVDDKTKEYLSNFGVIDNPPQNLPLMEDIIKDYEEGKISGNSAIICIGKVRDLWGDSRYNRIDSLRYGNQKLHIEKRGGYSYSSADTLSAFLRPSLKAVLTKGNNRSSMRYACGLDENSRVCIALKIHPKDISEEEMIRIESIDHNTDCNYRTNQSGDDKFKSAFFAKESWAVELYNFLKTFNIGVAGTLENAKFYCPSHSYISRARKLAGDEYTKKYLLAFTNNECDQEILGNATVSGALFLKIFSENIVEVDTKNNCDSFSDCLRFNYKERQDLFSVVDPDAKNLCQSDLTEGNGVYKGNEPSIARYVNIYNEYCRIKRLKFNGNYETAIPLNGKTWIKFVESAPIWMQGGLLPIAKTKLI
jgi:hypothetical protein